MKDKLVMLSPKHAVLLIKKISKCNMTYVFQFTTGFCRIIQFAYMVMSHFAESRD